MGIDSSIDSPKSTEREISEKVNIEKLMVKKKRQPNKKKST